MGVANELRDFEQVKGDPWMVRDAAGSLREAAAHLPIPLEAAGRLQDVASGVSWQGASYEAYRQTLQSLPMPDHLRNAVGVMDSAAGWLEWYADRLTEDQEAIEACRQRWLALGIPDGGEVPDDMVSLVQQIDDEATAIKQGHRSHLDQLAGAFGGLTGQTAFAQPPPGILDRAMGLLGTITELQYNFAYGIVEGAFEMVKGIATLAYYLNPVMLPYTAMKVWENREEIMAVAKYAWENPGDFALALGRAVVDWETLTTNPARWMGKLVPDIILTVLTAGSSKAATTAARAAKGVGDVADLAKLARRAEKLEGLSLTQRALKRGRELPGMLKGDVKDLARGDTGGLTRMLADIEQQTTIASTFERRLPGTTTSVDGFLRNRATAGWYGRLTTVDRWVNGMPYMTTAERSQYVITHSMWFANKNQNHLAVGERYVEDLIDDTDGKRPERFDFNWTGDGYEVAAPWDR